MRPPRGATDPPAEEAARGAAGGGSGCRNLALAPFRFCLRAIDGREAYREKAGRSRQVVVSAVLGRGAATVAGCTCLLPGAGSQLAATWATRCCVPDTYVPQHLAPVKPFRWFPRRCDNFKPELLQPLRHPPRRDAPVLLELW